MEYDEWERIERIRELERARDRAIEERNDIIARIEELEKEKKENNEYIRKCNKLINGLMTQRRNFLDAKGINNSAIDNLNSNFKGHAASKIKSLFANSFENSKSILSMIREVQTEAKTKKRKKEDRNNEIDKLIKDKIDQRNRKSDLINYYERELEWL